jgi:hypothetical protein
MGRYWMLTVSTPSGERRALIGSQPDLAGVVKEPFFSWISGSLIKESLPGPLDFQLDPDAGDYVTDFFPPAIPLMSGRMLSALADAGVDNIQTYDAILRDRAGTPLGEVFKAVNIVGRVACADLDASECDVDNPANPIGVNFESLVIDEAKARDLLFFRLHEASTGIVVHDSVKTKLDRFGLRGVDFVTPEDWSS